MADSVRMVDLAVLSRGMEAFRRLDPEASVLAQRLATQAAVKRVEELHKEVEAPERSAESRVRPRDPRDERDRQHRERPGDGPPGDSEDEGLPEREEGRLLDIKV
ncbi:MAG: hypothetical protein AB1578_18945 [Thermodesulfobacteriota bacterium]